MCLVPLVGILLDWESPESDVQFDQILAYSPGRLASIVVIVAGITDLLDGYFARKWKIESLLGKFLDPLADKLFLLVGLIMLMKLGRVEAWLVILLLSRELLITGLRAIAIGEAIVIAAGQSGKWKHVFQLIGLGFLMWYGPVFGIQAYWVGIVILHIALVISLFSGFLYLQDFFSALINKRAADKSELD